MRGLIGAFGTVAAILAIVASSAVAAADAGPGCRYVVAAPPGTAGNYLLIDRNESVGLRRVGQEVGVFQLHGSGPRVECEGRVATVEDVDKILFRPPTAGHQLTIEAAAGPFGPIEIYARFPKFNSRHRPLQSSVRVVGTAGPDTMRIGRVGRDRTGIHVEGAGGRPEVEVLAHASTPVHFALVGEQGDDRIDSSGTGRDFDGPLPAGRVNLDGGPGNDLILGGPRRDLVRGGPGEDRIITRGGDDSIDPGLGIDHAYAGPGDDYISSRGEAEEGGFDLYSGGAGDDSIQAIDGEREKILCGTGFDHVGVDTLDEWQRPECERAHGPGA